MKIYVHFLVCLFMLGMTTSILQAQDFSAQLTGSQEALPIQTMASGELTATLDGNRLSVSGSFEGLSSPVATEIVGGAHLHIGYAGQNGPVAYPLTLTLAADSLSGTFEDVLDISDEEVIALMNRQMYFNLHTAQFMGGELRGQLAAAESDIYTTNMFGSYEVPVVMSSGSGALLLEVIEDSLKVSGSFMNLQGDFDASIAGGAHLHLGLAGMNGGIEILLNATLGDDLSQGIFEVENNTFTLTEEQENMLQNRMLYANIHSTRNAPGEIRGQVAPLAQTVLRAHLSGSVEVPVVTSLASGMVIAEVIDDQLIVSGSFRGLESDFNPDIGAHLHVGMAGMAGPVVYVLTPTLDDDNRGGSFQAADNTFDLTDETLSNALSRQLYVNIHTIDNAPGELRGQLAPESQINFNGFLSGTQESPAVASMGTGGVKVELNGNRITVSGTFSNLSSAVNTDIAGGAHLHTGMAGMNGPILVPLNIVLDEDGTGGRFPASQNSYELTDEQVMVMRQRGVYVNIHTLNFAPGELRAQVLHEASAYFNAPLSGASEVPAVNTSGVGALMVEVTGTQAVASGAFRELVGNFDANVAGGSHLHDGYAGSNGPIAVLLNADTGDDLTNGMFQVADNTFEVSEGLIDSMRARLHYVNIHTTEVASGEIRGQVLPLATAYFITSLSGFNEVPPADTDAFGGTIAEFSNGNITVTGSFNALEGNYDSNIGSHLHLAMPGMNGGIEIDLSPTLSDDLRSGVFAATENIFNSEESAITGLFDENLYVNVHTMAVPSGELRGQLLSETNFFPTDAPTILSPEDLTSLTLEGDAEATIDISWTNSSDADKVVYIWQLAADVDFSTVVFQTYTGTDTTLTATIGLLDGLLEANDIPVGTTIRLYHRAVASDGSLHTMGETASVIVTRGEVEREGVDLELSADIDSPLFMAFNNTTITFTLTNSGSETATNIVIDAGLPEGFVYTSFTPSAGTYRPVLENWAIEELAAGETATLTLIVFALDAADDVDYFAEVSSADQEDSDSIPGNGANEEDDEVSISLRPFTDGGVGTGEGSADLSIAIENDDEDFDLFANSTFSITVTNDGPDAATNVSVQLMMSENVAFTSAETSQGGYMAFPQMWNVGSLENGESAMLTLVLFALDEEDVTLMAEVFSVNENDPDSTPNNGEEDEDDQASLTLGSNINGEIEARSIQVTRLYPSPTISDLSLEMNSEFAQESDFVIYNAQGQIVRQFRAALTSGFNQISLQIGNLANGVYYIQSPQLAAPQRFVKAQ
ncbi:MAG: CHRD domain-containing protein [Bacteroidota bacterium]